MNKLIKWINFWLVPINATQNEATIRIFEVGLCIGMIIGAIGFVVYLILVN